MSKDSEVFLKLLDWMQQLRSTDKGCAWSRQQTLKSLTKYTIEEAYELAEAIESKNIHNIKDELADLLLQFLFYLQIGKEQHLFNLEDIAQTLLEKDKQRRVIPIDNHSEELDAEQINAIWQAKKLEQRQQQQSVLDDICNALPSLYKAIKMQQRAADIGFDWPNITGVIDKLDEEINELKDEISNDNDYEKITDELGDVLFTCINLARHLKIDPDTALRHANNKFKQRFQILENIAKNHNKRIDETSIDELEHYWQQAKLKSAHSS